MACGLGRHGERPGDGAILGSNDEEQMAFEVVQNIDDDWNRQAEGCRDALLAEWRTRAHLTHDVLAHSHVYFSHEGSAVSRAHGNATNGLPEVCSGHGADIAAAADEDDVILRLPRAADVVAHATWEVSPVKPAVLAAERRAAVSGRAPREALHTAFDPTTQAPGIVATDLGVLAIWAAAGPVVAVRRFRWTPAFAAA